MPVVPYTDYDSDGRQHRTLAVVDDDGELIAQVEDNAAGRAYLRRTHKMTNEKKPVPRDVALKELSERSTTCWTMLAQVFNTAVIEVNVMDEKSSDPCIVMPDFGFFVFVSEKPTLAADSVNFIYSITMAGEIECPGEESIPDVIEVGDFDTWDECIRKLMGMVAEAKTEMAIERRRAEEERESWQLSMESFADSLLGDGTTAKLDGTNVRLDGDGVRPRGGE